MGPPWAAWEDPAIVGLHPYSPRCRRAHGAVHIIHSIHTEGGWAVPALDLHPGALECLWIGSQMGAAESSSTLLIDGLTGVYPVAVHIHRV